MFRMLLAAALLLPSVAMAQSVPVFGRSSVVTGPSGMQQNVIGQADFGAALATKADSPRLDAEIARAQAAEAAKASTLNFSTNATGDVVLGSAIAGAKVNTSLAISATGSITAGFDGRTSTANWLTTYAYGDHASFVGLSPYGDVGVTGASRNTDNSGAQSASIGTIGVNFNYNTRTPAGGWGGYFESRHTQGSGASQGVEINATEFGTAVIPTAADMRFSSAGLWVVSGGGCTSTAPCWNGTSQTGVASNASMAIGISTNSARFAKGIVVRNGALSGCDGMTAGLTCTVLETGRGSQIVFDDPAGTPRSIISSDASATAQVAKIKFTDGGVVIQNSSNVNTFRVAPNSGDVNGLIISGATSGNNPTLSPSQSNTGVTLTGNGGSTVIQLLPFVKFGEGLSVASLPSCDANHTGWVTFVTDAASPTYNVAVMGGGTGPSASINVFCNGSAWTAH